MKCCKNIKSKVNLLLPNYWQRIWKRKVKENHYSTPSLFELFFSEQCVHHSWFNGSISSALQGLHIFRTTVCMTGGQVIF